LGAQLLTDTLACVANVSVGFGSKERPKNGIFVVLSARKMGREPKKERGGWERGRKETFSTVSVACVASVSVGLGSKELQREKWS